MVELSRADEKGRETSHASTRCDMHRDNRTEVLRGSPSRHGDVTRQTVLGCGRCSGPGWRSMQHLLRGKWLGTTRKANRQTLIGR